MEVGRIHNIFRRFLWLTMRSKLDHCEIYYDFNSFAKHSICVYQFKVVIEIIEEFFN